MLPLPENINGKRVLISPLDWGMGHTTRCVSLIRKLLTQNNVVFFAGNDAQCSFMHNEFKELHLHFLNGYDVTLDSTKSTYWQMLTQLQKIKKAIRDENLFAEKFVDEYNIDLIISDNRYGFFSSHSQNILLTHQLKLELPYLKSFVNSQLKKWIEKFDCIWIPDRKENPVCGSLIAGDFNIPKLFIGFLCRFEKRVLPIRYDYLGIVSGAEPERSRFAGLLLDYLKAQNGSAALVGFKGLDSRIDYYPAPTTAELEELINSAQTVVSRAGYTSIMELMNLEVRAILIPTPGHFEQEYLASVIKTSLIDFQDENEILKIN